MQQLGTRVPLAALAMLLVSATGDSFSPVVTRPRPIAAKIVSLGANQSSNWSGYNQGVLEKGSPFTSVSGTWTVPTATQHVAGRAESSSVWVGVGGGCMEETCLLTDPTLIQAGTEQDVDEAGNASYSAWWEIIPLPSLATSLRVAPGDVMNVAITQTLPEVWKIDIHNRTSGQSFTTTVPYPSAFGTAEWIVETPIVVSTTGAGFAGMPDLSTVLFSEATANGANPNLNSAEALQLVQNGEVIATPSAPSGGDSFRVCTYSSGC
jgi:peptidase A4-like protein